MNFRNLSINQIMEIKSKLKDILKILDVATRKTQDDFEIKNEVQKEIMYDEQFTDPETYWCFRCYDKGVKIVRTNQIYSTERDNYTVQKGVIAYAVKCYGFNPKEDDGKLYNYNNLAYGGFKNLDDAKGLFKKYVSVLLKQEGFNIYEGVELFDIF